MDIHARRVWIGNRQLARNQVTNLVDLKIYGYIVNSFIFPLPGCVSVGVLELEHQP